MRYRTLLAVGVVLVALGCRSGPENPSFPVTRHEARDALSSMADEPKKLDRPLVIIGGYQDPGIWTKAVASKLRRVISDDSRVICFTAGPLASFDDARAKLVRAVDTQAGGGDRTQTAEVDVIGLSMGGLLARYAAVPRAGQKRLRIARLYTISSPHTGARMAGNPLSFGLKLDGRVVAMTPGSEFLRDLTESEAHARAEGMAYELVPYVRLGDSIVGPEHAAPEGQTPWWVPLPAAETAHIGAFGDARILADIARRLRDERPLTEDPPAPLPTD